MLMLARSLSAILGIASLLLSVQILLERRQYEQPFDPVVVVGVGLGMLLLSAAAFVRSPRRVPRLLAWVGIVGIVIAGAYLPFVAIRSAQDAILLSLVPLALALALAAALARGRLTADRAT
jgi:hypothetical protein